MNHLISDLPNDLMKLDILGSFHSTRLSFSRQLINEIFKKQWVFNILDWKINNKGKGSSIITVNTHENIYSLIVFAHSISDEERSDRVIADKWDLTFTLFRGVPSKKEFIHLKKNVPLQEKGQHLNKQITLSRANKSMRLYKHSLNNLAKGKQPDFKLVRDIGYLLRTTAVYGNGKFGINDFDIKAKCKVLRNPFWAEMLTVYMLKYFSIELINFLAKAKGGTKSIKLDEKISQFIGTGNATGLGMAPYIINHPKLIHTWIDNKYKLLKKISSKKVVSQNRIKFIIASLKKAYLHICQWKVEDTVQKRKILKSRKELSSIINNKKVLLLLKNEFPLTNLMSCLKDFSQETKEILYSIFIEAFPVISDNISNKMSCDENELINFNYTILKLKKIILKNYLWAINKKNKYKNIDHYFWYVSETKEEPRLGIKNLDNGYDKRLPLDICLQVNQLYFLLNKHSKKLKISDFILINPEMKYIIKRILINEKYKYSEIHESLTHKKMKPIDILRFKLSFFGATKFDPKSNLWTRITLFQGAPLPYQIIKKQKIEWFFPILENYDSSISQPN